MTKTARPVQPEPIRPELVCPAGTPAALCTAVDAGADAVYCGFQNATNARNFPGLNFTPEQLARSVDYAHKKKVKVLLALNTFPPAGNFRLWEQAVKDAIACGVDALIIADLGVADYISRLYPDQRLHLSVQAGAASAEAINYYCRNFKIRRVVLPRLLTIAEIADVARDIPCEVEAFVFGNIGMMAEGRCSLTNYATGASTNMDGVCSPAESVRYESRPDGAVLSCLGDFTVDCATPGENAGYPTICKGRYLAGERTDPFYAFEEPVSLNLTRLLPDLVKAGVTALKIEGRQRSRAYVGAVVAAFRRSVDDIMAGRDPALEDLVALTEGGRQTQGAFENKRWR